MIKKYLAQLETSDHLKFTTCSKYVRFFAEIMAGMDDDGTVEEHQMYVLDMVSDYYACRSYHITGSKISPVEIRVTNMDAYYRELHELILLDIAYRTLQVKNPSALQTLAEVLYDDCMEFNHSSWVLVFNKLLKSTMLSYFSMENLRHEVMCSIIINWENPNTYEGQKFKALVEQRLNAIKTFLQIVRLDTDTSHYKNYCSLKTAVAQMIYQKE